MSARGKVATPPGPGGVWLAPVGRRLVSAGISCEGETGGFVLCPLADLCQSAVLREMASACPVGLPGSGGKVGLNLALKFLSMCPSLKHSLPAPLPPGSCPRPRQGPQTPLPAPLWRAGLPRQVGAF